MASPTFHLSLATPDDIPAIITTYLSAFSSDPLSQACFPRSSTPPETFHSWLATRFQKKFAEKDVRIFKIEEVETGKMAAIVRWVFPHVVEKKEESSIEVGNRIATTARPEGVMGRNEESSESRVSDNLGKEEGGKWPPGANTSVCEEKFGGLEKAKEKYVDSENMYVCELLATNPAYQGKGLATMLLKHVLDQADAEGRTAYIEATDKGYGLYYKLGWRTVDVVEVELESGKKGINRVMIREARAG